jgi:hypothetical protein
MSTHKKKALQKIGRNVVNLSKIEGMLKLILISSNYQSPISKISETLEARKKRFKTKTLGQLAREYFKVFDNDMEHIHQYPEDRKEKYASLSFSIESEDGTLPEQKRAFKFLVSERNRLIHHMLIEFNHESKQSCLKLINELDEQNEMIQREYKNLQTLIGTINQAIKQLVKNPNQRDQSS